jgi:hypothetical protein
VDMDSPRAVVVGVYTHTRELKGVQIAENVA